jgi:acetolactate synthase-1/3 small subunit
VTGCFARRGYNIQSLAVGPSEKPEMSRMTVVVPGNDESIQKLFKQLSKLVYVQSMVDLTYVPMQQRELILIKVRCTPAQRSELRNLEQIFRASILDVSANTAVLQMMGKARKIKALTDLLEPYGILEIARTGVIAIKRESGVDSEFLKKMVSGTIQ